ncbi:MAG TPA: hypothetical protein VFG60_04735 [Burkholderiaceae bacterium]|nr:hypothetical protein [Burkholderiaceae bacterium]
MKLGRSAIWVGIGLALAAVFIGYLRPDAVMALATQLWNCF